MTNKYWYKLFIGECPWCGRDKTHRVRVYTKKPKSEKKRIVYMTEAEAYDGCNNQPLEGLLL